MIGRFEQLGENMRSVLSMVCVAAALVTFAVAPPQAGAQETIALAIEGWQTETRADGVTYYRCASKICAAGSVVSYKAQPHRTTLTLADFENHHRGLAKQNAGSGSVRDAQVTEPKERTIEGVRVLQISREVTWQSNNKTFTIEARLIGPDRSFSLVSDSPQREWTANNFEGFRAASPISPASKAASASRNLLLPIAAHG